MYQSILGWKHCSLVITLMKLQVLDFPSEVNDGKNQIKYLMQMFSGTGQQIAQVYNPVEGGNPRWAPYSPQVLGTQKHVHPK